MHTETLIALLARNENAFGLFLLGASAFLEYVFPPFPGDLVAVYGAFLVARRGWSAGRVLGVLMIGSALGCMVGYGVGRWLARSEQRWSGRLARVRPQLDRLVERFARHGALYLVINRFLPSVRALFFVAAGLARLPFWKMLVFGLASALAWNALLFAIGATAGAEWSRAERIFATYGLLAWSVVAAVAALLLARWAWKRHLSAR